MNVSLDKAIAVLKAGGLVAYPTDTLYGLGANALDLQAVAKVFKAKQRPLDQPLPLLLAEVDDMDRYCADVPEISLTLARAFWPGGLTMVLRRRPVIPDIVTAGGPTVAVRVPGHPIPRALARGLGAPITGTSANLHRQSEPRTAKEVHTQLGSRVDFILQGRCALGRPSTIIDLTGGNPRIVRAGAISQERIEQVLGRPVIRGGL